MASLIGKTNTIMGKINSRAKGCRGELQFAKELGHYGVHAIRGQQRYGGEDSPDVIHDLPDVHFEVKFNEKMAVGTRVLEDAMEQAIRDAGETKTPVVAWKKSRGRWHATFLMTVGFPSNIENESREILVTMSFEDFMYARVGLLRAEESVYVSPKKVRN